MGGECTHSTECSIPVEDSAFLLFLLISLWKVPVSETPFWQNWSLFIRPFHTAIESSDNIMILCIDRK